MPYTPISELVVVKKDINIIGTTYECLINKDLWLFVGFECSFFKLFIGIVKARTAPEKTKGTGNHLPHSWTLPIPAMLLSA